MPLDAKYIKKLMEHELNEISSRSERNRRVYLILRDYGRFLNFALEILLYQISNLPNNSD